MARTPRWIIAVTVLSVWVFVACGGETASTPTATSEPVATATTAGAGGSPTADTATATPSSGTPTTETGTPEASPEGSPVANEDGRLAIDGEPVAQVAVAAPGLDIVYATAGDSLFRRDGDTEWTKVSEGDADLNMLVQPTQPNTVYRGGHPPCARGGDALPFQKSVDGGQTWETIPGVENVRPLAIHPTNPERLYGDNCSLVVSNDDGKTWQTVQPVPGFDLSSLSLAGTELYGVYTSEGGTSRLVVTDVSDPTNPVSGDPLLEFWGGGVVLISPGQIIVGEPHGIHISTDDGQTWSFSREGLEDVTISVNALVEPIPQDEISQGFGIFSLVAYPGNPDRVFAGTVRGLYESTDGGQTWERVEGIGEVKVTDLAFAKSGAQLYVTTEDGVFLLTDV